MEGGNAPAARIPLSHSDSGTDYVATPGRVRKRPAESIQVNIDLTVLDRPHVAPAAGRPKNSRDGNHRR